MSTMKAVVCESFGPPEVLSLKEVPRPEPKDDQVRIAIGATTVTSACTMMRRGDTLMSRLLLGLRRPRARYRVMGIELAGTVDRVGARVTRFRPGDRVFGFTGFAVGAYAEYICLPETASLAHAPAGVTDEEAASLVDGPTTALYFLRERARIRPGDRIAIVGASGSIGTAAVQLARHFGAEVTGICSGGNAELVRSLGAHHVVDYAQGDFTAAGATYDIVFDTVGKSSFGRARRCLAPDGRYLVTVGSPLVYLLDAWTRLFSRRKFVFGMSVDKRASLRTTAELVAQGALRPLIDRRYPLGALPDAHRYVETGRKKGNVVIFVPQR